MGVYENNHNITLSLIDRKKSIEVNINIGG